MWLLGFELRTFGRAVGCSYPLSHLINPSLVLLKEKIKARYNSTHLLCKKERKREREREKRRKEKRRRGEEERRGEERRGEERRGEERRGDNLQKSVLSFHHVVPRDQAQTTRPGNKCLYLLSPTSLVPTQAFVSLTIGKDTRCPFRHWERQLG
jgi:hypothetical protein